MLGDIFKNVQKDKCVCFNDIYDYGNENEAGNEK